MGGRHEDNYDKGDMRAEGRGIIIVWRINAPQRVPTTKQESVETFYLSEQSKVLSASRQATGARVC